MKFKLVEYFTPLMEDIAAVRKNFPKIKKDDFDRLITLDPTYIEGRDSVGIYGKWILNLFNKNRLTNENHITDLLTRFESVKRQLKNKDINSFKTPEDLESYLNDNSNYNELSDRQKLRQVQDTVRSTQINKDAELVFENDNWEVWIPHTYEASCKLGQGSNWCTATTSSDYYFKNYTSKGPLYINIQKGTDEKYQFHAETESWMDKKDRSIDLDLFFEEHKDLCDFYATIDKPDYLFKLAKRVQRKLEVRAKYSLEENDTFIYNNKTKEDWQFAKDLVTKVIIEDNVTIIKANEFSECRNITSIKLPKKLKRIGDYAFESCGITSIEFPDTLTQIGEYAFDSCNQLLEVYIPNSVTQVGEGAFGRCSKMRSIRFSPSQEIVDVLMCSNNISLTNVELPMGVTLIDSSAFRGCTSLTSIEFPNSLDIIGSATFRGASLIHLDLNNVSTIGQNAFENNKNLKSIEFGPSCTSINTRAFALCPELREVTLPANLNYTGNSLFADGHRNLIVKYYKPGPDVNWARNWNMGYRTERIG